MNATLQVQLILDTIQRECRQAAAPLLHVAEAGVKAVHHFDFNIGSIQDYSAVDIRESAEHQDVFKRLAEVQGPVVYVFEICSLSSPSAVLAAAKTYEGRRTMPAFRSNIDDTSPVLYVGKVKKALWGRVIQHLGFSRTAGTQGLQLYHWARGLALELKLTAFEFEDDMADLLPLVERAVAKQLKPLLGKHE
jgi:hypothetical protein